jgi:hypothetical protein
MPCLRVFFSTNRSLGVASHFALAEGIVRPKLGNIGRPVQKNYSALSLSSATRRGFLNELTQRQAFL